MTRFFALLLVAALAGCGCAGNQRCVTGWTYTSQQPGVWQVTPVYGN